MGKRERGTERLCSDPIYRILKREMKGKRMEVDCSQFAQSSFPVAGRFFVVPSDVKVCQLEKGLYKRSWSIQTFQASHSVAQRSPLEKHRH